MKYPVTLTILVFIQCFSVVHPHELQDPSEERKDEEERPPVHLTPIHVLAPSYDNLVTTTVIERSEIELQNSFVAYDVLKHKPGIHSVQRLGFTGSGLSRLTIRGLGAGGPAGVQVFTDGRPDATVSFAHPTPSAMLLADVQTIEVIHGPSPVLYGAGLAGVVNITTAPPERGYSGFYRQSFGEYDTAETALGVAYGGERGYVRVSGTYRETDGYLPALDAKVKNVGFKGGYQLTEHWNVSLSAGVNEDAFGVFGDFSVPGPFTDPRTDSLDLTQTVLDAGAVGTFDAATVSFKVFHDDLEPRSQVLDPGEERAEVSETGIRFRIDWRLADQTQLITGLDYLHAEADNSPVLPPFAGPGLRIPRERRSANLDELGAYAFLHQRINQFLTADGGIRLIDHSEYGFETAEEAGLVWRPAGISDVGTWAGSAFRVRYTNGYQSPTLQQLFGIFRGGVEGPANPNLEPERLRQLELGYNYTGSRWEADIAVFRQEGDDLISRPTTPPPRPSDITNSIEFENYGFEAALAVDATDNLSLFAGVTWLDLELKDRFVLAPERAFDLGVTYRASFRQADDFALHLTGRYADRIFDVSRGKVIELDDYIVVDLHSRLKLTPNVALFVSLDNLLDEEYELVSGIPAPPRTLSGGVRLQF